MIYLDHNASSVPTRAHLEKLFDILMTEYPANPSSPHAFGRNASVLLTKSRKHLAKALNVDPSEIIFTSGGTEANNIGTRAVFEKKCEDNLSEKVSILTTAFEHPCILKTFELIKNKTPHLIELIILSPDLNGYIKLEDIVANIKSNTVLISVTAANNEIGTIQPVKEFGDFLHFMRWGLVPESLNVSIESFKTTHTHLTSLLNPEVTKTVLQNLHFHVDAVQIFGKLKSSEWVSNGFDSFAISAHKVGALQGIGALILKRGRTFKPLISGGSQEKNRRAGTENLPGIISLGLAAEEMVSDHYWHKINNTKMLTHKIYDALTTCHVIELNSQKDCALPNTIHFSFLPHTKRAEDIILHLDMQGIYVSSGSACSSSLKLPSHVVLALQKPQYLAENTIRISLGPDNTDAEIDHFLNTFFMILGDASRS